MAGGHGGGDPARSLPQTRDDPFGQAVTRAIHRHLQPQPPGRRRKLDVTRLAKAERHPAHALKEGVSSKIIGAGTGGRRRRVEDGEQADRLSRPGWFAAHRGAKTHWRVLRRHPAYPDGRDHDAGAALPRTVDIDHPSLDGGRSAQGRRNGRCDHVCAQLGRRDAAAQAGQNHQGPGDPTRPPASPRCKPGPHRCPAEQDQDPKRRFGSEGKIDPAAAPKGDRAP
jgi:hypothetical protein